MSTAPQVIEGEVVTKAISGEAAGNQFSFATGAVIEITAEEKLSVSRLENDFLRAQTESKRLQGVIEAAQKQFPQVIQALVDKYKINALTHVFDNIALEFRQK